MTELDTFAYLARFSAVRLIWWWHRRPVEQRFRLDAQLAIGWVKGKLRGKAWSAKLTAQCEATRTWLVAEMLWPSAAEELADLGAWAGDLAMSEGEAYSS